MENKKKFSTVLLSFIISIFFIYSSASFAKDFVKKSSTGICHDKNSKYYVKTKKFIKYKTMKEGLQSGGRLPKN